MIVPKNTIWQFLRSSCLASIPPNTRAPFTAPRPINAWRREGYYTVTSATGNRIVLVASECDFGAALLSDAEHLLDNAAEHQTSLYSVTDRDAWLSPGWSIVTIYYWGFFAALALTRLLGRTIWFLDKEAITDFKRLAATTSKGLGAGAFRLECGPSISATDREIVLQREDARLHDTMWRQLARLIKEAHATSTGASTTPSSIGCTPSS